MVDLILHGGMGRTLKPHPLAQLVPPMTEQEFAELKADVGEHGLQEAITLFEGKILDGLHRERACRETGTKPRYREFEGDEEAAAHYVLAANIVRRHLTDGQRAMVAVQLLPQAKREARKRQVAAGKRGAATRRGELPPVEPRKRDRGTTAAGAVGAEVGVGERQVRLADEIARLHSPTAELVRTGEIKSLAEGLRRAKATADGGKPKPRKRKSYVSPIERRMLEADELDVRLGSIAQDALWLRNNVERRFGYVRGSAAAERLRDKLDKIEQRLAVVREVVMKHDYWEYRDKPKGGG